MPSSASVSKVSVSHGGPTHSSKLLSAGDNQVSVPRQRFPTEACAEARAAQISAEARAEEARNEGRRRRYSIEDMYSFERTKVDALVSAGCAEMAMTEGFSSEDEEWDDAVGGAQYSPLAVDEWGNVLNPEQAPIQETMQCRLSASGNHAVAYRDCTAGLQLEGMD